MKIGMVPFLCFKGLFITHPKARYPEALFFASPISWSFLL